jgi:hypothetical protein
MKMKKSIAILGKGPSILRCTKDFIDSFDEVAGCGRPVFKGYEKYIGNRLHYHFANKTGTPFTKEEESELGIKHLICTASDSDIRKNFQYRNLDASTGILAFDFFLKKPEYKKIALLGFDLFQKGEKMYYFKNEEFDPAVNWLWRNGSFDKQGRLTHKSLHDTDDTWQYLNTMFDNHKDKQFYILSSYAFNTKENLKVL